MHLAHDRASCKAQERPRAVLCKLRVARSERAVPRLPYIELEQIRNAQRIAVLLVVEREPDLVKHERAVHERIGRRRLAAHHEPPSARHGLEDVLVRRGIPLRWDQRIEPRLQLSRIRRTEELTVRVPVHRERVEARELVDALRAVLHKRRLPVLVRRYRRELRKDKADRKRVLR